MVTMSGKAVFKCHPSSHHFDERHIRLIEPIKIGRSVAKARPTLDNGIFDCKVLSRNHALIWYDSDSVKFFLQDTKSSNGTFVNNNRLSRGSEESPAHEICSGDIVQFGVDVMENSRRGVVTHGCIVAQLSLFHPDGTEATRSDNSLQVGPGFANQSATGNNIPSQELYQLSHYLKEALHREQMLEQKLAALQRLVSSTQEATETSWQALIDEDRLLSRLEVVESQLRAYSKANSEESIRKELVALQEDKSNYEKTVKESLKKALEEKLDACRKLADTERMLSNSEDECTHVRDEMEAVRQEQESLLERCAQLEADGNEAAQVAAENNQAHSEEVERSRAELLEVQERLAVLQNAESALGARAEELQAENDFLKEQLLATKERLEETQEALKQAVGEAQLNEHQSGVDGEENKEGKEGVPAAQGEEEETDGNSTDKNTVPTPKVAIPVRPIHHLPILTNGDDRTPTRESGVQVESLWREANNKEHSGKLDETTDGATDNSVKTLKNSAEETVLREVLRYKYKLEEAEQRIAEGDKSIASLQGEVSLAQEAARQHQEEVQALEARLHKAEENTKEAVEQAVSELRERLSGSFDSISVGSDSDNVSETSSIQTLVEEPLISVKEEERQMAALPPSEGIPSPREGAPSPLQSSSSPVRPEKEAGLQNHIHDSPLSNSVDLDATLQEIDTLKDEVGHLKQKCSQLSQDNESLVKQLQAAQQEVKVATDRANELQAKLKEVEISSKKANDQLPVLQEKLDLERKLVQKQSQDIEGLNIKLKEADSAASNNKKELATCREHITTISGALEREKEVRQKLEEDVKQLSSLREKAEEEGKAKEVLEGHAKQLQLKVVKLEERIESQQALLTAKEEEKSSPSEGGDLKSVMITMEGDLRRSYEEKEKLCDEIVRLRNLFQESEAERGKLKQQMSLAANAADVLKEKETLQRQLGQVQGELERVTSSPGSERPELDNLRQRLEAVTQELNTTRENHTMMQGKWLPVGVISIAIVAAVFQSLLAMWLEV